MSGTILSVRKLSVVFPNRHGNLVPIDNISFELNKGEILGFVGESGAGKSMTGSAIIGLIDPPGYIEKGEIWLEDIRIDQLSLGKANHFRGSRISMVFQDPLTSLNPLKKIGDQLIETIMTHLPLNNKQAKRKALNCLEEVGINPDRFNAYPHEFSGGMRQRVVIALALSAEPDLIIADEPTTALDVSVQEQVLKILKKTCNYRNASVILITHDMGVISETTDRVAVMYAGRLVEIGKTEEILKAPKHPYTRGLIASTPSVEHGDISTELYQIKGTMPRLDSLPSGCSFNPRCEKAIDICKESHPEMLDNGVACWIFTDE